MAIYQNPLREDETSIKTPQLAIISKEKTTVSMETGTAEYPAGTPLQYNSGSDVYERYVSSGTGLAAILWPNKITLDATDNVLADVMVKGEIMQYDAIEALVPVQADKDALKIECKNNALAKGIVVRGIANINQ